MKDFNYQLNHANLLKVESEPDLPVSSDENMQTYKGKLKFSDTVNTFIQAIMSSDSFKFSSIPLQQQIQHLSFIINMWTISSSEYLLDIITEEHVKLMVCVEFIYKYTIRSIVCEASCHPVTQSFGHLIIQSFSHSVI